MTSTNKYILALKILEAWPGLNRIRTEAFSGRLNSLKQAISCLSVHSLQQVDIIVKLHKYDQPDNTSVLLLHTSTLVFV